MACSRGTFTFTSSLNSFLLSPFLCYFLAVNVYHFTSFILLSIFRSPSPLLGYTFFLHWVWLWPQHRSRRSAKIGWEDALLLRAKQTWPLPAHVPMAHLSVTLQSTVYDKSNVVILVCNFVLVGRERASREERSPPDPV